MTRIISSLTALSIGLTGLLATGCDVEEPEEDLFADLDNRDGLPPEFEALLQKLIAKALRYKANYLGLKAMPAPPEVRPELVELGQALSFDKILSGNENISCLTCHHPLLATDDDHQLSIGEGAVGLGLDRVHPDNIFIPRNAPPLFNLHAMDTMFWDGRVNTKGGVHDTPADEELTQEMIDTFEFGATAAQAMFPVTSRREMRGILGANDLAMLRDDLLQPQWAALMARLGGISEYIDLFEAAYPGEDFEEMTFAHAANAIAGFEIAAFSAHDTPWDRFLRGDDTALSLDELRGAALFMGRGNCVNCHNGTNLSDLEFHNTALPQFGPGKADGGFKNDDWGRAGETFADDDKFRFRTAPLRNVALTAPYGHAGQFHTLEDFITHYIDPETSLLNYDIDQVEPLLQPTIVNNTEDVLAHFIAEEVVADIDEDEVQYLAAFLNALTDPSSTDLSDTVPDTVPSGLPVAETVVTDTENLAGTISMPLGFDTSGGREMQIWEPSMCEGSANIDVSFDRNANTLSFHATFDGLPHRPTYCYEYDPSTPWNQYPECVSEGRWQIWFVGHFFTKTSTFYYDLADGALIGNVHDIDLESLPPTAIPVEMPVLQMLCSDFFESDPETLQADFTYEYDYDNILDMLGSAGVYTAILPMNLFAPTELDIYYTQGGLPAELAMNFDEIIEDIAEGRGGMMAVTSYEPFPKPSYLDARDNLMIGWGGAWPKPDPFYDKPVECGTNFQWNTGFGGL
ncbi:MAG: hypothetical protein H6711_02380 [Myxococcales bacterium]|nr:hypothetical protein [Myxococcales bacterium]